MAKIIDFNDARQKLIIKKLTAPKSVIGEFKEKYGRRGVLAYFPRKQREKLNCPKCGGFVATQEVGVDGEDAEERDSHLFCCLNCGWRGYPIGTCRRCKGVVVRAEGKEFCFHCLDNS